MIEVIKHVLGNTDIYNIMKIEECETVPYCTAFYVCFPFELDFDCL